MEYDLGVDSAILNCLKRGIGALVTYSRNVLTGNKTKNRPFRRTNERQNSHGRQHSVIAQKRSNTKALVSRSLEKQQGDFGHGSRMFTDAR